MKTNFFKSIKFRLAIIFTVILFVFAGTIILLFNIAINNYLSTRQVQPSVQQNQQKNPTPAPNNDPNEDERAKYSDQLESIKQESVYGLIVLAVISMGLGYYISGRFLRPLNKLNTQIDKLRSDNLGSQIENPPENEVGRTINYFNDMSLRLQKSFDQQSRFVQDASHELRTPLTILRTNMETVLDDKSASKEDLKISMKDALDEIDSATELANDLLALSKPQSKIREIENMPDVINQCVAMMNDIAKRNKVFLEIKIIDENLPVLINKPDFIRAINNIIDNAIKYSKGSKSPKVRISVSRNNNKSIIRIKDNGLGIPQSDITKIFDRFYRVDKSRDRQTGGFGLGLPIAKKIVDDHMGKITVVSDSKSTEFIISIPIDKKNF